MIGVDLVCVSAFAELLADSASHFKRATFTHDEVTYCEGAVSRSPAQHFAARYAAKEATLKALDTACAGAGVTPPSISLLDIEVLRDEKGRPSLLLHGKARALANVLALKPLVSLSHDGDHAIAFVTLSR